MIGLDTTAIIDIFKGVPAAKKVLDKLNGPFVSTQQNYLEIYFGIDPKSRKYDQEAPQYEEFFSEVQPLHLTNEASRKAAELYWRLKNQGKEIGKFDCIIAATFLVHGVTKIVTRNAKHFEKIPGLKVISY